MKTTPKSLLAAFVLLLPLLLTSCHTSKQTISDMSDVYEWELLNQRVSEYEHVMDSLYQVIKTTETHLNEREERDSTYNHLWTSDTLIVQDSTYIKEYADGSTRTEYYHNETRIFCLRDTVYKDRVSFEYLADLYTQYELNDHLQRDYSALLDSFTFYRDSVANATHTDIEVVQKRQPWFIQVLSVVGAVTIVVLIAMVLFSKLFSPKR